MRRNLKFETGPAHIFNPIPTNEEEVITCTNAMSQSGNYPICTDGCFNVGISGGCGTDCFVYKEGKCTESESMEEEQI